MAPQTRHVNGEASNSDSQNQVRCDGGEESPTEEVFEKTGEVIAKFAAVSEWPDREYECTEWQFSCPGPHGERIEWVTHYILIGCPGCNTNTKAALDGLGYECTVCGHSHSFETAAELKKRVVQPHAPGTGEVVERLD